MKRNIVRSTPIALLVAMLLLSPVAQAEVKVASIFGDNMVLQRDLPIKVWGTATAGEQVSVKLGAAQAQATADASGKWMAQLPAMPADGNAIEMTVSGANTVTFKNAILGDVWVCSGQSNMEMNLGSCNAPEDISSANFPNIRCTKIDHRPSAKPEMFVNNGWRVCDPGTAGGFTAAGFYFARKVQKETNIPIGLIDDNWGGTAIEPWLAPEGLAAVPELEGMRKDLDRRLVEYRKQVGEQLDVLQKWVADTRKALAANGELPPPPAMPGHPIYGGSGGFGTHALYYGMINPIVPFGIKGALWYQGEANGGEGDSYFNKMQALIGGWRQVWNQGEFPFYFVQLAAWQKPNPKPDGGDGWARVRMAQLKSLTIPHTGMAVSTDIGDIEDIHPKDKQDVGERLALWALAKDYGKSGLVYSGPLYKGIAVEGNKIRVSFDSVGGGLIVGKKDGRKPTEAVAGGTLKGFAVAGADKKWVWADAVIDGNNVVVSSPQVASPVAVRYAFSMNPEGANLYNKEGLPASPFRSDDW